MGATARTILLLQLAALASCAQLTGYHPQEWYDARAACRQEMNERIPRSEPPDVRGAYVVHGGARLPDVKGGRRGAKAFAALRLQAVRIRVPRFTRL
jgi:hypothetical protein